MKNKSVHLTILPSDLLKIDDSVKAGGTTPLVFNKRHYNISKVDGKYQVDHDKESTKKAFPPSKLSIFKKRLLAFFKQPSKTLKAQQALEDSLNRLSQAIYRIPIDDNRVSHQIIIGKDLKPIAIMGTIDQIPDAFESDPGKAQAIQAMVDEDMAKQTLDLNDDEVDVFDEETTRNTKANEKYTHVAMTSQSYLDETTGSELASQMYADACLSLTQQWAAFYQIKPSDKGSGEKKVRFDSAEGQE